MPDLAQGDRFSMSQSIGRLTTLKEIIYFQK
jgi:hypothetical protein